MKNFDRIGELATMVASDDEYLCSQAAKAPLLGLPEMLALARGDNPHALAALAARPGLPSKAIRAIVSSDPAPEVVSLALRGYKGHKALREVSRSGRRFVRRIAAAHPNTEEVVLSDLALDNYEDVRMAIVAREEIPLSVQRLLARDPSAEVRKGLARYLDRRDFQLEVYEILKEDIDPSVSDIVIK